ncbi:MAG: helical backbone metal receptor [Cruoricaptor ignavus]|nr:helical backbone metal receptor [Cruoricaptor ignavus]
MKIVSLVPSITETLFDFGLDKTEIIGRTKFCIHPKSSVKDIEIIGGTKNLNLEKIKKLNPDLVIANKEENEKSQIENLQKSLNVWVTDIENLEDNKTFLSELGAMLNRENTAEKYIGKIADIFDKSTIKEELSVAYLIWKNPYMTVGSDTFIHEILTRLGLRNIFNSEKRYPEITVENMVTADYIFLSTEPYPFSNKHITELQTALPKSKIILVDGEAFSWYGTHLAKCEIYFQTLKKLLNR